MEKAFAAGYDPALDVSKDTRSKRRFLKKTQSEEDEEKTPEHIVRDERALVDRIVGGMEAGRYYLISGPKGTGKATMILDAMRMIQADGAGLSFHPIFIFIFVADPRSSSSFHKIKHSSKPIRILKCSGSDSERRSTTTSTKTGRAVCFPGQTLETEDRRWILKGR